MSDNQRRTYCRILFMVLCALPTSLIGYKIFHPQTVEIWQSQIQAQLGIKTTIDSVETPRPYVTILRGLEFSDPEDGTLFKAVEAQVFFDKDVNTVVVPYRVRGLNNVGLATLVEQLNRHLIRSREADKRWQIIFEEDLQIENAFAETGGTGTERNAGFALVPQLVFQKLQIHVVPEVDGTTAKAVFQIKGQEQKADPVICSVSRRDANGEWWQIETYSNTLPCWLLARNVPQLSMELGEEALFSGNADYSPIPGAPRLEVDGEFTNVDLAKSYSAVEGRSRFATVEISSKLENQILDGEVLLKQADTAPLRIQLDLLAPYRKEFSPGLAIRTAMKERLQMPVGTRVSDGDSELRYKP